MYKKKKTNLRHPQLFVCGAQLTLFEPMFWLFPVPWLLRRHNWDIPKHIPSDLEGDQAVLASEWLRVSCPSCRQNGKRPDGRNLSIPVLKRKKKKSKIKSQVNK